jgi:hypothetical protein
MSERTSYAPGTPCWVELATPDVDGAVAFYGGLFGWEIPEQPNSAELGGYRRALKGGVDVAGVMPLMAEGQPPVWTTQIAVADADAATAAAREAGGSVIAEPMDVMDIVRFAIVADPTGAVFGLTEPKGFRGAGLVNEPGTFCWNELATRDTAAAKSFYAAVFGWGVEEHDMGEMGTYTEWKLGEDSVGGMMDMANTQMPAEVPPHWLTYFAVENTDAALETIKSSGGRVAFGPIDIPAGRFAVVADPFGAMFAVIQLPEEAAA